MMRVIVPALLFGLAVMPAGAAEAQTPPAHYTVEDTDLGTLLDDPAAKAILVKQIPDIVSQEQIDMARSMTLKTLQSYAGDKLTDKKLADIEADLAKLPVKK